MFNFGGIEDLSLIEYPGLAARVIFLRGCDYHCSYCYNKSICSGEDLRDFSDYCNDLLFASAVVFSGGEPTLQPEAVFDFAVYYKKEGKKVGLYTNGSRPGVIEKLLERKLIDFISLDIKTTKDRYYPEFTNYMQAWQNVEYTLYLLEKYESDNFKFRLVHTVYDDEVKENVISYMNERGFPLVLKPLVESS
jgi:anaerobic ribonucleoside-triphosphate reductase activating protein